MMQPFGRLSQIHRHDSEPRSARIDFQMDAESDASCVTCGTLQRFDQRKVEDCSRHIEGDNFRRLIREITGEQVQPLANPGGAQFARFFHRRHAKMRAAFLA